MILASIGIGLPLAVFLLAALTLLAKCGTKWGRAGSLLRAVLAVGYALLALAGVGGLALAVWLVIAGGGKAMLLLVVLVPLSLFVFTTGLRLFRFVLSPPSHPGHPRANSSGWEELDAAAERARHGAVAAHLQPNALRRIDPGM